MSITCRDYFRGVILIILSTSTAFAWLYPDISCVTVEDKSAHHYYNHFCLSDEYRFNREAAKNFCYERCMLEELKILNVHWLSWDAGLVKYRFFNHTGRNYNVGIGAIFGKEKAGMYSTEIFEKCNEILNDLANKQNLSCRKWDPLYKCVNDVFGCEPYQPLPV